MSLKNFINNIALQLNTLIIHFLILLPLIFYLAFHNLDSGSNFGTGTGIDESWYIQVSQEISKTGSWWQPTREGQPFFYKPPFKFWLTSLSASILGESIVSYRIIDAALGAILVVLAYFTASIMFCSISAGFFAALSLLGCYGFLFYNGIRFATLDTLVVFLSTIALLGLYFVSTNSHTLSKKTTLYMGIIIGLLIALAILTKSVLGYYVFGVYGTWLLLTGQLTVTIKNLKYFLISTLLTAVLVPACWFVPHALFTTGAWQRMFGYELVARFGKGFHNTYNRSMYWNLFLKAKYLPVFTTLTATMVMCLRAIYFKDKKIAFFAIWGVLLFVVFSLLSSRLPWYVAPCYFPFAILNGAFFGYLLDQIGKAFQSTKENQPALIWTARTICALLLFFGAAGETYSYVYHNIQHVNSSSPRLAIDEVVHDLSQLEPRPHVFSLRPSVPATRERIFYNMLSTQPVLVKNLTMLKEQTHVSENFIVFTNYKKATQIANHLPFAGYKLMPPVDFPQGPDAFYRKHIDVAFVGVKDTKQLEQLKHFKPRKIVMELASDRKHCSAVAGLSGKRSYDLPLISVYKSVNCQFQGDRLLAQVPTRLALNIGHIHTDAKLPSLIITANNREIAKIDPFHSRQRIYDFTVPAGIWLESENFINLSYDSENQLERLDPEFTNQEQLLVSWVVVDMAGINS